jgi:hypothetical protein
VFLKVKTNYIVHTVSKVKSKEILSYCRFFGVTAVGQFFDNATIQGVVPRVHSDRKHVAFQRTNKELNYS